MPHHMENLTLTLTHNQPHHIDEHGAAALIRRPLRFSSLAVEPSPVDWRTLLIHHASPANICQSPLCCKRKNTRKHKNNHPGITPWKVLLSSFWLQTKVHWKNTPWTVLSWLKDTTARDLGSNQRNGANRVAEKKGILAQAPRPKTDAQRLRQKKSQIKTEHEWIHSSFGDSAQSYWLLDWNGSIFDMGKKHRWTNSRASSWDSTLAGEGNGAVRLYYIYISLSYIHISLCFYLYLSLSLYISLSYCRYREMYLCALRLGYTHG